MELAALKAAIVDALEDIKGKDIVVMDVSQMTPMWDALIVASGDSNRQVKALANNVVVKMKELGVPVLGTEGERYGEWVLVDLGNVVVHVMHPAVRQYYSLEQLWGGQKPTPIPR